MLGLDESQQPPAGARCGTHPDWPAEIICAKCGDFCCRGCWVEVGPQLFYCTRCDPPLQPPERRERLRAHVIDSVVFGFRFRRPGRSVRDGCRRPDNSEIGSTAVVAIIVCGGLGMLAVAGLQAWFVHKSGQSIGKRAGNLQVVDRDGKKASLARVLLLRNAIPIVAISAANFVGVGWLLLLVDSLVIFGDERRCVHDYIAGTRVVALHHLRRGTTRTRLGSSSRCLSLPTQVSTNTRAPALSMKLCTPASTTRRARARRSRAGDP